MSWTNTEPPPAPSAPSSSSTSPSSSRPSASAPPWSPLLLWVWQVLTNVLVPFSLSSAASRSLSRRSLSALEGRAAVLRPCDLVLVRTPGRLYSLMRRASHQPFDHLAVVMADGRVLHVGPPRIRLLPAELFLQPWRQPQVLRPTLSDAEAAAFLSSLSSLIGQPYDTTRVLQLIAQLATKQHRQQQRPPPTAATQRPTLSDEQPPPLLSAPCPAPALLSVTSPSSSLICTDAILHRLLSASAAFRLLLGEEANAGLSLDVLQLGSWSIHDLHILAQRQRPFLRNVQLPPLQPQPQPQPQPQLPSPLPSASSASSPLWWSSLGPLLHRWPFLVDVVGSVAPRLSSAAVLRLLLCAPLPALRSLLSPATLALLSLLRLLHPVLPLSYLGPALLLLLTSLLIRASRATGFARTARTAPASTPPSLTTPSASPSPASAHSHSSSCRLRWWPLRAPPHPMSSAAWRPSAPARIASRM